MWWRHEMQDLDTITLPAQRSAPSWSRPVQRLASDRGGPPLQEAPVARLKPAALPAARQRQMPLASPSGAALGTKLQAKSHPYGHRADMRDRVMAGQTEAMTDCEMLEMLLYFAQPTGETKALAHRLLQAFGSYANVLSAPAAVLMQVHGMRRISVAALKLVREAAVRLAQAEVLNQSVLSNWDQLMNYLNAVMAREPVEQFRILFLDTRNRLIADELQNRGTINQTPIYPREVAKRALECNAASLILVHNHPSGDPTPSSCDLDMTMKIERTLKTLEVVLHDHVIVGNGRWISLRNEGFL